MAHSLDLGSGGSASFPFDRPGDSVSGKVLNLEEVQQTDMDSGKPAVWDNGQPKMMYRVELQTQLRDGTDDDGVRSVYLKGSKKPESQSSLAAVLAAVRAATGGRSSLTVGGTLKLTYVGDGEQTRRGYNAPKLYAAEYIPPAVNLGGEPEQPAQQPQQGSWIQPQSGPQSGPPQWAQPAQQAASAPQQPTPQQAPAPAQQGPTPEQLAAMQAAGLSPEVLAALAAAQQH